MPENARLKSALGVIVRGDLIPSRVGRALRKRTSYSAADELRLLATGKTIAVYLGNEPEEYHVAVRGGFLKFS